MKKIIFIVFCALSIFSALPTKASDSEISKILRQTGSLMREKNYPEAQKILMDMLRKHRNSYKLWLGLGYVLEADNQKEKALKAFYNARDLKMGIEGLNERIIRLEQQLKNNEDFKQSASSELLAQARYEIARNNTKNGLIKFSEAVIADRKLLATENEMLNLGLQFFSGKENKVIDEDRYFYLGLFNYFAGNYSIAQNEFEKLISRFPDSKMKETARTKLEEINLIQKQMHAAAIHSSTITEQKVVIPAVKEAEQQVDTDGADKTEQPAPAYSPPTINDEYAGLSSDDLYSEALSIVESRPTRAIGLISRAISSGSNNADHYQTLADLYASRKGFQKEAIATYRKIMEKFPSSAAAEDARQKILAMNPDPEKRAREVSEYFSDQQ